MLKIATLDDHETIKGMALKFANASGYKDLADDDTISNLINHFLRSDPRQCVIILHGEQGMLAGTASPFLLGKGIMASEVAWWVEPEARKSGVGKELLEAFEYWAQNVAMAEMVTMVALEDKLGEFYTRNGYKLYERAYMKVL